MGRGGSGLSFNTESLGINRGDVLPAGIAAPPATFPTLVNKPVQLETDQYVLNKYNDLRNYLRSSQYFLSSSSDLHSLEIKWDTLPEELRPVTQKRKRKRNVKPNLIKKQPVDVNSKFKELESKEIDADSDTDDEENKSNTGRVSGVEDEDDIDEEMDGGTDYASNYFDNGEGYEDGDDDNLDEGGIY